MKLDKVKVVKQGRKRTAIQVHLSLCQNDQKLLETYLDHLGMSVNAFVRRLVQKELTEETLNYETKTF